MASFDSRKVTGRSVNEKAYQIAWMVMRHELEYDEIDEVVGSHYGCILYDGLLERIHATLDGGLSPEEELLALKGESVLPLPEADEVPVMRAMFRKEFLLNPDPEKRAWHAFLLRFHAAIDPKGLTWLEVKWGQYGVSFRPGARDGPEVSDLSAKLNRIVREASKGWDFPLTEGPTIRDIQDEADRYLLSTMSKEDLVEFVLERGSCCDACLRHVRSLLGPDRAAAQKAIEDELVRLDDMMHTPQESLFERDGYDGESC